MSRFLTLLSILLVFAAPCAHAAVVEQTPAKQAIMIDFDTGMVLFEKNPDQKMPTSSMSKVITAYLVFEALKDKKLALSDEFTVSEKAWRMQGSKMFVDVNKKISVENLLRGVIVQSGNDATIVLAEGIGGTEDEFARALTKKAKELGMNNSNFVNASGWPDPNHYSTARDLAILGYSLIKNFPEYYSFYSEKEFSYNGIKQENRNPLLYRDMGADGIKTGHTEDGGYGLIGSGVRDSRRVILVVNGLADDKERAAESARLLEWGLSGFENHKLFGAGEAAGTAAVVMGQSATVDMVSADDIKVTVPKLARNDLKVDIKYNEPLVAPIQKGQEIGVAQIHIPQGATIEIPLLAAQDVQKLGFLPGMLAKAKLKLLPSRGTGG
ncbi:MAG TPA: D-alanyl-D-alanine carboxypeptidase [Rhodospirillaceae bacterium]|nr:D-alanyl-D-alanine carboxypeptidase [Rhodospirillaceae bacterium]